MAALGTVAGYPQYVGYGTPEIWSKRILQHLYSRTCCAAVSNKDYEGEIKNYGAVINIRKMTPTTIHEYVKGQELDVQKDVPEKIQMEINRGWYWNRFIDDVDRFQGDLDYFKAWTADAALRGKIRIDRDYFASVYADAHASNKGATAGAESGNINLGVTGTPRAVSSTNVLEVVCECGQVLDEQDVPETDRYIVLPVSLIKTIKISELKAVFFSGDRETPLHNLQMPNGKLPFKLDRFEVYASNLLTKVTDGSYTCYHCQFGHLSGVAMAMQITESDVIEKMERQFGRTCRGLTVGGWKTTEPKALGDLYLRVA